MRPLCLEFPEDRNVVDMGSEYLWGPSILVAPVTRGAAKHWSVCLPTGTWHDFWTGKTYTGARWIEVEAPLDRMPLLIRGGAIIPMGPVIQYDAEAHDDRSLELLIYPETDSSFTIYEDDGSTYAYETGARSLTEVRCVVANGTIVISLGSRTGEYSGQAVSRPVVFRVRQGTVPRLVNLTGSGRIARYGDRGQVGSTEVGWWYEDGFVCVATIQQRDALELVIST
jgi:alpha-glucosidase (family GH31 glycosyl hydrolase)